MLHIPALWYFDISLAYPQRFYRLKLVVILPMFYVTATFVKYCYITDSWLFWLTSLYVLCGMLIVRGKCETGLLNNEQKNNITCLTKKAIVWYCCSFFQHTNRYCKMLRPFYIVFVLLNRSYSLIRPSSRNITGRSIKSVVEVILPASQQNMYTGM